MTWRNRVATMVCLWLCSGCTGMLMGPGGVICKAGDLSIGGDGREVQGSSGALNAACTNSPVGRPANACCYKAMIFITRSCPLANAAPEGGSCWCPAMNPYGYVFPIAGVSCRMTHSRDDD